MTEEEIIGFPGRNHIDIFRFENEEELLKDVANAAQGDEEQYA